MKEKLVNYALRNMWADPVADLPVLLQPARITRMNGELVSFTYKHTQVYLPNKQDRFQVYETGRYGEIDFVFNSLTNLSGWVKVADLLNVNEIEFMTYLSNGQIISTHDVYLRQTLDGNVIIAVRLRKCYEVWENKLFIRSKKNAFYKSPFFDDSKPPKSKGLLLETEAQTLSFRQEMNNLDPNKDKIIIYKNGKLIDISKAFSLQVGDTVSYYYDPSVKKRFKFKLSELETYRSTLDKNLKYLIHPPKDENVFSGIDYIDDVDFYLVYETEQEHHASFIYRHYLRDVRNVTHKDWGISYDLVQSFLGDKGVDDFYIYAYVKHSGREEPVSFNETKMHELYQLEDSTIINYLLNKETVFSEWTASYLESSKFLEVVRDYRRNIDVEDVLSGYGYSSLTHSLGQCVLTRKDEDNFFELPEALDSNVTVIEYDAYDKMHNFYYHSLGSRYVPRLEDCKNILILYGRPELDNEFFTSDEDFILQTDLDVRIFSGIEQSDGSYIDLIEHTGDNDSYNITKGKVNWKIDTGGRKGIVVTNQYLKVQQETIQEHQGLYKVVMNYSYGLRPENVLVYLNKRFLNENVDYYILDDELIITNTSYLKDGNNDVLIFHRGIETENPKYDINVKSDFVVGGFIANDDIYDIRYDKVYICHIAGKLFPQEKIAWEEDGSFQLNPLYNGLPFSLIEGYVPLPGLRDWDNYPRRKESRELDSKISSLMTDLGRIEEQEIKYTNYDYEIYSPFLSQVIADLIDGSRDPLEKYADEIELRNWLAPYYKYLDLDPCSRLTQHQLYFVSILPHFKKNIKLSSKAFSFVKRISEQILRNVIFLEKHITILEDEANE